MTSLPVIDFAEIAATTKAMLQAYGSTVRYYDVGDTVGKDIKVVLYRDTVSAALVQDADSSAASALINPDDFLAGPPKKFSIIKANIAGFAGTWSLVADAHPIMAQDTLPLYLVELRRN
jgi:hypothetical protein